MPYQRSNIYKTPNTLRKEESTIPPGIRRCRDYLPQIEIDPLPEFRIPNLACASDNDELSAVSNDDDVQEGASQKEDSNGRKRPRFHL